MVTPQDLAALAGFILSLALGYLPWVASWYAALPTAQKVTVIGVLLIASTGLIVAVSCGGLVAWVVCDRQGLLALAGVLLHALAASQGTYLLLVRPFKPVGPPGPAGPAARGTPPGSGL